MVDFALTERQKELKKIALDYAINSVIPRASEADLIPEPDKSFDWELVREVIAYLKADDVLIFTILYCLLF